jgi:hypothetical protein
VFSQDDLVRRQAARGIRRNPLDVAIDRRIAGGGGRTERVMFLHADFDGFKLDANHDQPIEAGYCTNGRRCFSKARSGNLYKYEAPTAARGGSRSKSDGGRRTRRENI